MSWDGKPLDGTRTVYFVTFCRIDMTIRIALGPGVIVLFCIYSQISAAEECT